MITFDDLIALFHDNQKELEHLTEEIKEHVEEIRDTKRQNLPEDDL